MTHIRVSGISVLRLKLSTNFYTNVERNMKGNILAESPPLHSRQGSIFRSGRERGSAGG